ncbi:cyclodeaminase/cyclohydrolase family protein [Actinomycetospora sp. CA-101289]|uniref:cyclodeaminase/cyclohydrolase family protein n=1 Tax=Actinomycetospora sp. CA-101289 TaxID=3239893 RepID=UPI003D985D1D
MRSETVEHFLESLASRSPGPGGRAGAALHAAHGAALVAKAARDAEPRVAAEHADTLARTRDGADELRADALRLAVDEGPPRGPGGSSVQVIDLAERVLALVEALRPLAPRAAAVDLAAAAEAVRAAAGTARVDVEVDLADVADPGERERLLTAVEPVDDLVLRAAKITAFVRERILR